jgi:hypothetical protein
MSQRPAITGVNQVRVGSPGTASCRTRISLSVKNGGRGQQHCIARDDGGDRKDRRDDVMEMTDDVPRVVQVNVARRKPER